MDFESTDYELVETGRALLLVDAGFPTLRDGISLRLDQVAVLSARVGTW